jgi:hypothetical protein
MAEADKKGYSMQEEVINSGEVRGIFPSVLGFESEIRNSKEVGNIVPALIAARKQIRSIPKTAKHEKGWHYMELNDVVEETSPALLENDLLVMSSTVDSQFLEKRATKYSTQHAAAVLVVTKVYHASGEWIEIKMAGEGQDSGDKSIYKANTGARKYGLLQLLGLATSDDPEADKKTPTDDNKNQEKTDYSKKTTPPANNKQTPPANTNQELNKALYNISKADKASLAAMKDEAKRIAGTDEAALAKVKLAWESRTKQLEAAA